MDRSAAVSKLCDKGIIAIIRADSGRQLIQVAESLLAGGVDCIEITMTTPNALEVIASCRKAMADTALIGVGSVTGAEVARRAIDAGAQYIVTPVLKTEIIGAAHRADLPCIPGALSPTEILRATDDGADMVKVFPAGLFGPKYFKNLLAPLPHLKLTPTGGVDLDTAADWIAAGAVAIGVGSALVTKAALAAGDFAEIRRLAGQYVSIVAEAREKLKGA